MSAQYIPTTSHAQGFRQPFNPPQWNLKGVYRRDDEKKRMHGFSVNIGLPGGGKVYKFFSDKIKWRDAERRAVGPGVRSRCWLVAW